MSEWSKSEENKERLKKIGFQKGNPPPKGSGRKKFPEELRNSIMDATPEALENMIALMNDKNASDGVRFKAAEWLLSAVIPKAKADTNVNVNHSHSIAGMLAQINSLKLPGAKDKEKEKMIDITPEEDTDDDD